jgi:hypothetical protein
MSAYPPPGSSRGFAAAPGEDLADFRARLRAAQAADVERRRNDLAAQASDATAPAVRIRIWERLHHTALPADAGHPLVPVIAAGTRLTVAEVGAEQARRAQGPAAAPAVSPAPSSAASR